MAEKTEKTVPKQIKVFDVAPPGKQPSVDATARPIIVTNRTIIQDPMMAPATHTMPTAPQIAGSAKIVIRPLGEQKAETSAAPSGAHAAAPTTTASPAGNPEPTPAKPKTVEEAAGAIKIKRLFSSPQTSPETSEPAATDAALTAQVPAPDTGDQADVLADVSALSTAEPTSAAEKAPEEQSVPEDSTTRPAKRTGPKLVPLVRTESDSAGPSPADTDITSGNGTSFDSSSNAGASEKAIVAAAAEEDQKQQQELEELIAKERYFVPLNAVEKRRSRVLSSLGLLLVLLLAVVLVALMMDAGFIAIPGLKPVTNFF